MDDMSGVAGWLVIEMFEVDERIKGI